MGVIFYNAGDRIDEVLSYSITGGDDPHCIARWHLQAPKEDFFDVPTELTVRQTGENIAVQFAVDISRKFGSRGVIRIKSDYDPDQEDPESEASIYPFARTRDAAIERGRAIWMIYLRKVVEAHLTDCQSARAAGGNPKTAVGFTKRALKILGITDPGEQFFTSLSEGGKKPGQNADPAIARLEAQNQMMLALLMQLLQGKTVDPEALAKLQSGETAPANGSTSGVMTGELKKPLSAAEAVPVKGKAERSKIAAEQLQQ